MFPNALRRPSAAPVRSFCSLSSAPSRAFAFAAIRRAHPHLPRRVASTPSKDSSSAVPSSPLPRPRAQHPRLKSSIGFSLVVLSAIVVSGTAILSLTEPADLKLRNQHRPASQHHDPPSADYRDLPPEAYAYVELLGMPSTIPPGRPGNLTPEQEEKLREFWGVLARVAGFTDAPSTPAPANGTETAASTETSEGSGKKSRTKGRLSLFKRKHGNEDTKAETDSVSSGSSAPVDLSSLSLDDDKHGANKAFKAALADQTPEELRAAIWSMCKHDNPDGLLLRFLRARKWDVNAALIMLVSTMQWRSKEMHLDDDIMAAGELGAAQQEKSADAEEKKLSEDFLAQMRMGKSFLHGVDKEGRPLCYVNVRLHRQGEQNEKSLERFTVYTIETARMMLRPPIDTATVVFDMTGFSMANMDYSPVKFMIKCFEANYPESLGAVLVHKAPWVFQGIWSIIRGWLDPVVASKVHFTKTLDDLSTFIPLAHIPRDLGGNEDWSYAYIEPSPTENAAMNDTAAKEKVLGEREELIQKYEDATMRWVAEGGGDEVKAERTRLAEALRANYWRLDPFVRARSLYDRTGVFGRGEEICFYPAEKAAAAGKKGETSAEDLD